MGAPRIALLLAAMILAARLDLLAQQEPIVAPGARVRVTAPSISRDRLVGTVVEMGEDTCVLEVERRTQPVALPLASLETLEVSQGKKSKAGTGALIGLVVGAGGGAALGAGICSSLSDLPGGSDDCGGAAIAGALLFGLPSCGLGALIGWSIKVDRWEEVQLDRLRLGRAPGRDLGFTLSVSLRL